MTKETEIAVARLAVADWIPGDPEPQIVAALRDRYPELNFVFDALVDAKFEIARLHEDAAGEDI